MYFNLLLFFETHVVQETFTTKKKPENYDALYTIQILFPHFRIHVKMVGYNLRSRKIDGFAVSQPLPAAPTNSIPAEAVEQSTKHPTYPKPVMSELNRQVQAVIAKATWWDLYGVDWCIILSSYISH